MTALASILLLGAVAPAQLGSTVLQDGWEMAVETVAGQRPAEGAWRPAAVPGTFEEQLGEDADGVVWYRRAIERPAPATSPALRYRVEVRAAATEATVYWNGARVGAHRGGWTPFHVNLPGAEDGGLRGALEIRLDEKRGHHTQGFLPIIQPHFGGIWQEVLLHADPGPTIDFDRTLTFGDLEEEVLRCAVPVRRRADDGALELAVRVHDGLRLLDEVRVTVPEQDPAEVLVPVPSPRPWEPGDPQLYDVELALHWRGREEVLHRLQRRVGFRHVSHDGTMLLWNGNPLQVRGMLHWGFSPPDFAPSPDPERWRQELETIRSLGCNLVKCCLWVPPRSYYEVADEMGILVWQEYPTWHAQLTREHLAVLAREYDEFFAHDRSFASVAFRSITCETGENVDEEVLRRLYHDGHAAVPNSLIVDNSSWITWMRIHDFWDEHPYGNNGWWPGKLEELQAYIADREHLPLLFGECIASDTWFDRPAWETARGTGRSWFEPWCLAEQVAFEDRLRSRWGQELVATLLPVSLRYALRNRKYQCERMRLSIPDGGYVLSVIRDFPKARMGFFDDLDRLKWSAGEWAWHRDTMLCLDTEGDRRAFLASEAVELPVRVSHFGRGPLRGPLELTLEGPGVAASARAEVRAAPGQVHPGAVLRLEGAGLPAGARPVRLRLSALLRGAEDAPLARNEWELWLLPAAATVDAAEAGVRVSGELDRAAIELLEAGGKLLHLVHPGEGSLDTQDIWYLKGAPWAPPHPLHERVPPGLLCDLQSFDLEREFVVPGGELLDAVDPILAFWDTHDTHEVKSWLFVAEARVGKGRLLFSALDHETVAGRWLQNELVRHLAAGPEPDRELDPHLLRKLLD